MVSTTLRTRAGGTPQNYAALDDKMLHMIFCCIQLTVEPDFKGDGGFDSTLCTRAVQTRALFLEQPSSDATRKADYGKARLEGTEVKSEKRGDFGFPFCNSEYVWQMTQV
eukprot:5686359-Amphidinium_carterae.1